MARQDRSLPVKPWVNSSPLKRTITSRPNIIRACRQIRLVSDARRQLDPVDKLITDAKWDSIRTIIKTPPLAEIKVGYEWLPSFCKISTHDLPGSRNAVRLSTFLPRTIQESLAHLRAWVAWTWTHIQTQCVKLVSVDPCACKTYSRI